MAEVTLPCRYCGTEFTQPAKKGRRRRYCQERCRSRSAQSQVKPETIARLTAASVLRQRERLLAAKPPCIYCGGPVPLKSQSVCAARACVRKRNNACNQRLRDRYRAEHGRPYRPDSVYAAIYRRKALARGAPVVETFTRREIFERDGWVCGMCGWEIDPEAKHPDPRSASLDHIHPLALGGSHTRGNVRLACLACNLSAGGEVLSELARRRKGPPS